MPYDDLMLEKKFSHCVSLNDPAISHLSETTRRSIVAYAREQRQQRVVETPQRDEAWVREYTKIIAQETSAHVDMEIRKAIGKLRTELFGQIDRACARVYAEQKKILRPVFGALQAS